MKKALLFLFTGLISTLCLHAQDRNTIQPPAVYQQNRVRLRERIEEDATTKAKEFFAFNADGQYTGFMLTDNETGRNPQLIIRYTYKQQELATEADTSFYGTKPGTIKKSVCSYDGQGRLLTKTMLNNKGDTVSITNYAPTERKETEQLYRAGKVYRQQSSYYDEQGKTIRFTGTEMADANARPRVIMMNLKPVTIYPPTENTTWDYTFKNTYDTGNRLIHQQRLENNEVKSDTDYLYNTAGLLTEMHTTRFGSMQVIKFKYTYFK